VGRQQAAHFLALLGGGKERRRVDGTGQEVVGQPPRGGDGDAVEPAGEVGEHGVEKAAGGRSGGAQDDHRRRRQLGDQAEVAGDEGGGLPRSRPAEDPQHTAAPVVDHRLLLGCQRQRLHRAEATEGV
jgi:hypothetical protein